MATTPRLPRKPPAALQQRAAEIHRRLLALYPDAACALAHRNAFELLVATILSAQCTDARVNIVTPSLFKKFPSPRAFAKAPLADIEASIRSTGFFRNKARSIQGASRLLLERFGGQVPDTMEQLLELPGVARKTANVVLGNAFGKNEGMVVDTHIGRLAYRMGFTKHVAPPKIEQDLMSIFPRESWTMLAHLLIFHGRRVCAARKPQCGSCMLADVCPRAGVKPAAG
jgi:endonuclease-3